MELNINNTMAMAQIAEARRIKNYINAQHKVLSRPDFDIASDRTFHTAKIVLQSIKPIIRFHSAYLCGNPVSLTGNADQSKLMQSIYDAGFYSETDLKNVINLIKFGNSYEYVYMENGQVKSKVLNNDLCYPIYENGQMTGLVEKWNVNLTNDDEYTREYTQNTVKEYKNGVLQHTYRNTSGLPIHYVTLEKDRTDIFGCGLVSDLILIQDQIEELLSKVLDSVVNLSTNPIGVIKGNRLQPTDSINTDVTGAVMNLDSDSDFKYATADLDINSIKMLIDQLCNQFWQIACVPSALYGQSNVSNVSSISLEMLFNNTDAYAKLLSFSMKKGIMQRNEYISKMIGLDVTGVTVNFNLNRPVDNSTMVDSIINLYNANLISKESAIRQSPYSVDVTREMELIDKDKNDTSVINNNKSVVTNNITTNKNNDM